jgi:hypothetical protein
MDRSELLFERFKYEDEMLGRRTDWFLLFHAILLEAFFTSEALAVSLFGFITAFVWLSSGVRQWWNHKHLQRVVENPKVMGEQFAAVFSGISRVRATQQSWLIRWAHSAPAFAILIPLAATCVWLHYLAASIPPVTEWSGMVVFSRVPRTMAVAGTICVGIVVLLSLLGNKPQFKSRNNQLSKLALVEELLPPKERGQ